MDKQTGALDAGAHDLHAVVRDGAMSPFQIAAIGICMAINALDGFDVMSIAFAAPLLSKQWALSPVQLGLLFSGGIAGMALGSLLLSPLADIFGRRALVLLGLAVITLGMGLSGAARGLDELLALRFLTGLGIGALLSSINTIVTEYSSHRRRDLAMSFMTVGYPIGAAVGGAIAVLLVAWQGWRAVFLFGAALSALLIPVVLLRLPESLDFLLAKRPKNALARVNALLVRMRRAAVAVLPDSRVRQDGETRSVFSIFERAFAKRTLLLCSAYFLTMLPFYFVLNWTPKVLVDEGLSVATGISGAVLMNATGVVGGLLFGALAAVLGTRRLTSWIMLVFFASIAGFGLSGHRLALELVLASVVGFFLTAAIAGLYAVIGAMYPPRVRNTGAGLAIGLGRIGAVVGPYLGGVMIAAGWPRPAYCIALASPLLVAGILIRRVPLLSDRIATEAAPIVRKAA